LVALTGPVELFVVEAVITDIPKIKIDLVDDHAVVRAAMRDWLSVFQDMEVVAEASSVSTALDTLGKIEPDVVLLDVSLQDGTGFDVLALIQRDYRTVRVIMMSTSMEREFAARALAAGADAYVKKGEAGKMLAETIRVLMQKTPEVSVGPWSAPR
jgi:two-component system, NarL family, invasion response regulator UvrY